MTATTCYIFFCICTTKSSFYNVHKLLMIMRVY